jgi:hypothetical protein
MATLEPSNKSRLAPEHQLSLIRQIQDRPNDSYFLCGAPGLGKTHLMTALYRTALETWVDLDAVLAKQRIAVFRVTASVLLDQHVQFEKKSFDDDKTPIPLVTVAKLQWAIADGYRVCLFIDEIDKVIPTEFKLNKLCQLVDVVWASNGQLVATSNKSPSQLLKKWDSDAAGTLLRRFGMGESAHTLDFDEVLSHVKHEANAQPPAAFVVAGTPKIAEEIENDVDLVSDGGYVDDTLAGGTGPAQQPAVMGTPTTAGAQLHRRRSNVATSSGISSRPPSR